MTDISMTTTDLNCIILYNLEVAWTKGGLMVIGPINNRLHTEQLSFLHSFQEVEILTNMVYA